MNIDERKERIAALRTQIAELVTPLQDELYALVHTCPHQFICTSCETQDTTRVCAGDDYFGHGGARCIACGKAGDWYCHASPDRCCHYRSRQTLREMTRYVVLANGALHQLPEDYDGTSESDDWCIFCGQPEERK